MSEEVDAIIIGAGVIGASIAFELCKRGYRTLNIDKLPAAGYGPTSNSCSIVRAHYSSREGVAMAYRNFDDGTKDRRTFNLYAYRFALNSSKTVKSVVLPNNAHVVVLGATLLP